MSIEYIADGLETSLKELRKMQFKAAMLERTIGHFDSLASPHYAAEEGSYAYIPLNLWDFTDSLLELETALKTDEDYASTDPEFAYRPVSFLEVGCGIGRNLFLVKNGSGLLLSNLHGIEIGFPYIVQAREIFKLHEEVTQGDALTFDYGDFDVIYYYRPFTDEALQAKFERRLIRQAKPGAYIIGHLNAILDKSKLLRPTTEYSKVFKKIKKTSEPGKGKR